MTNSNLQENNYINYVGSNVTVVRGYTDRLMQFFPNALNVRLRMPIDFDQNPREWLKKVIFGGVNLLLENVFA